MTKTLGLALLALCFALSGCSAMQGIGAGLSALGPSGPSVDATAVVGAEAVSEGDAVIDNRRVEDRRVDAAVEVREVSGVSNVDSRTVQEEVGETSGLSSRDWTSDQIQVTNTVQQIPSIVLVTFLILFALGWLLPGPDKIVKWITRGLTQRRKDE